MNFEKIEYSQNTLVIFPSQRFKDIAVSISDPMLIFLSLCNEKGDDYLW